MIYAMSPADVAAYLFAGVVLTLAVYRIVRLIGWDAFPPVRKVRDRLLRTTVDRTLTMRTDGITVYRHGRPMLADLVQCPYCLGFWVGLAAYGAWLAWPTVTLAVLAPFALSGAVGIVARMLDP